MRLFDNVTAVITGECQRLNYRVSGEKIMNDMRIVPRSISSTIGSETRQLAGT